MAMTKAEKAKMEELETALALCWPAYPAPQPMTREEIEAAKVKLTPTRSVYRERSAALGWFYNAHSGDVTQGWSDGIAHSRDNVTGDHGSQNMGRMYRTKALAAMAMRLEMSRDFAKRLAAVDRIIAGGDA
jgi:hypothetical protein